MKLKIVIPSRSRWTTICTHQLLNDFDLVVPISEIEDYKEHVNNYSNIVGIPDKIEGLGAVRNWILDYYSEEIVVMIDDDIRCFMSLLNLSPMRINKPDLVHQIISHCALCCLDAGLHLFSFNQMGDVRKYQHTEPFKLNTWVGSIVGVIDRKYRFTEQNKLKVDADYTLQHLLKPETQITQYLHGPLVNLKVY